MANKRRRVAFKRSDDDISKKTLAVFVAIVVIVSVVGTWLILTNSLAMKSSESIHGFVKLGIEKAPTHEIKNTPPVGGQVSITIEEP